MNKCALIDGNNILFRAFFSTYYTKGAYVMKTSQGLQTNAVFTFVSMIEKIISDNYQYIFVAFDKGKETFRHKEYTEYKATRKPIPVELKYQASLVREYLDLRNVKWFESLDYEADDLISIMSNKIKDMRVDIYSDDQDLLQLIKENVRVIRRGNEIVSSNNFSNYFNFPPEIIKDYKAIIGDSSDNLKGIKGIGEKGAIELLNEYKTLDGIYANIDKISGKKYQLLVEGKNDAYLCYKLVTLIKDVPIGISIDDLYFVGEISDKLEKFYKDLEMFSLIKSKKEIEKIEYTIIEEEAIKSILIANSVLYFELFNDSLVGIGIYINNVYYFTRANISIIKEYLESDEYKKSIFDSKKVILFLHKNNINIKGINHDFLLYTYVKDTFKANEDIAYMVENVAVEKEIYGEGTKKSLPEDNVLINYIMSKVQAIIVNFGFEPNIEEEFRYLYEIELRLSYVLASVESRGVYIDKDILLHISKTYNKELNEIEKFIFDLAGEEFNINSTKQLGVILFDKLLIPYNGKKNTNGYSTAYDILEKLTNYPIVRLVLDYKELSKLLSTYVNGILELVDDYNLVYPLYKQAFTQTGRLSSINPNIQNIPIRTEKGQVFRKMFKSRFENGLIMAADYSQIELRILAKLSNDEKMSEAFEQNLDLHTKTAMLVFKVDEVSDKMRKAAKAINFGIIYGMGEWSLSNSLKVSVSEAKKYIEDYFNVYFGVYRYLNELVEFTKINNYSKTFFGRRRTIDSINNDNKNIAEAGKRLALNTPIQGTAADIIKIAMVNIYDKMKLAKLKSLMIAQVHDELVFDCFPGEEKILWNIVGEEMKNIEYFKDNLLVSLGLGANWLEAK